MLGTVVSGGRSFHQSRLSRYTCSSLHGVVRSLGFNRKHCAASSVTRSGGVECMMMENACTTCLALQKTGSN
jgi:hypothetical protein